MKKKTKITHSVAQEYNELEDKSKQLHIVSGELFDCNNRSLSLELSNLKLTDDSADKDKTIEMLKELLATETGFKNSLKGQLQFSKEKIIKLYKRNLWDRITNKII